MRILTLCILVSLAAPLPSQMQPKRSGGKFLPVPYRPQQASQWCWAASGSMIMRYWKSLDSSNTVLTQCEQVTGLYRSFYPGRRLDINCPMSLPPPDSLNIPYAPFCVGEPYTKSTTGIALSWDSVKSQLDGNMPFATEWSWAGVTDSTRENSGNHWLVVTGYQTSSVTGMNYIAYSDPWAADSAVHKIIPFSEYQHPTMAVYLNHPGYQYMKHCSTYYNIKPVKR